jgi:uncharacterized membrane protein
MLERSQVLLTFTGAIGAGLVGGIFFAFSTFVMAALGRLPPQQGVDAMNAINVTVINPAFMAAFLGTALICLVLAVGAVFQLDHVRGQLILAASLLYLIGCFGVTMIFNVPLNDRLAAVGPAQAADLWSIYLRDWTLWNHVRTVAPVLSAVLFTFALRLR